MSMKILENNGHFRIFNNIIIKDQLEKGVYEICYDSFGAISLEKVQDIILPEKIYGAERDFINVVLNKFQNSQDNITVGLVGDKGLGKSLTANILAKEMDLPVIKITNIPHSSNLISFLENIKQEVIVLADEFGKTFYHEKNKDYSITQQNFLSYLDGGSLSEFRKIFIFTSNFEDKISKYLFNRPSRINYYREFKEVSISLIKEICDDLLENPNFKKDLIDSLPLRGLNIDTIISLIKEINFQNRKYSELKSYLNFRSESSIDMEVTIDINGKKYNIRPYLNVSLFKDHETYKGEDIGYIKDYPNEPTIFATEIIRVSGTSPVQQIPVEYCVGDNSIMQGVVTIKMENKFLNTVI